MTRSSPDSAEVHAFERWLPDHLMPSEFSSSYLFKRNEDGDYKHSFVLDAWEGWNARASLQPATPTAGDTHRSDCAAHNAPALPVGPCDCGAELASSGVNSPSRGIGAVGLVSVQDTPSATTSDAVADQACPYKGPFGCKCEPGECKYRAGGDAVAATTSEPVAFRVVAGRNSERHLFENKRDAQLMRDELEENGWLDVTLTPLYADAAQSVTEPSDEWCNAFLKATGEWIEPHEPETECGVPMECEITQEFADELNADARKQIRKGYAAACSIPSTENKTP